MKEPKVIKEETILARLQRVADEADKDVACKATDKICIKTFVALLKDMVKSLPAAEDEDPNCQVCYWHDLRKDPSDLPDQDVLVRCILRSEWDGDGVHEDDLYRADGKWMIDCGPWGGDFQLDKETAVIAWTHDPQFDKEVGSGA